MNNLSEAEQVTIAGSLDRIVEIMEVGHIDAAPILEGGPIEPTTGEGSAAEPPVVGGPGRKPRTHRDRRHSVLGGVFEVML